METEIGRALIGFAAAWAFLFALRTTREGFFVAYTVIFSICVAILVI